MKRGPRRDGKTKTKREKKKATTRDETTREEDTERHGRERRSRPKKRTGRRAWTLEGSRATERARVGRKKERRSFRDEGQESKKEEKNAHAQRERRRKKRQLARVRVDPSRRGAPFDRVLPISKREQREKGFPQPKPVKARQGVPYSEDALCEKPVLLLAGP